MALLISATALLLMLTIPFGMMGYISYHVYAGYVRYKFKAIAIGKIKESQAICNPCKVGIVGYEFITNKQILASLNTVIGYIFPESIVHLIIEFTGDATYAREQVVIVCPDLWRIPYRYPVGAEIGVLYDRRNPHNSVMLHGEWSRFQYVCAACLLLIPCAFLSCMIYGILFTVANYIFSVIMITALIGACLTMMVREYYKMNYKFKDGFSEKLDNN